METRSKIVKVGRPKGTLKDPNRLKIMNPNGRKIDVDGVQYNKYIKQGYVTDGSRLILPENVVPKVFKVGRPRGCKNKVRKVKIEVENLHSRVGRPKGIVKDPNRLKIMNPGGRKIDVDGVLYNKLLRQGYIVSNDGSSLILPENVVLKVFKVGRPKGIKKEVEKDKIEKKFVIHESDSALKGFKIQYTIDGTEGIDEKTFLNKVQSQVINLISKNCRRKTALVLTCIMERVDMKSGETNVLDVPFRSKDEVVLAGTDIGKLYKNATDKIFKSMGEYQMRGSNWKFKAVRKLDIHTVIYKPLKGNSYILLPAALANKKAIINMKNEDDQCFKWCITRALNPVDSHPERINKKLRSQAVEINWDNIIFPVSLPDIDKFEKQNVGINVNVFGYEANIVVPLRLSTLYDSNNVDLMLISNDTTQHYCLIKNFSRLLTGQTGGNNTLHYCRRCLNGFRSIVSLDKHKEFCNGNDVVARKILPEPGTILEFNNFNKSMRVPFVIYADFESFIKPIDSCVNNPDNSYTNKYQKHTPSSVCYYIKCFDDEIYKQKPVVFTAKSKDDDIAQIFVNKLEADIKEIYNRFKFPKKMIFTKVDADVYNRSTICHICERGVFSNVEEDNKFKVRDHCHLSGKFRGAAHKDCNLNYKIPKFFPVLFHNLSGYDCHLFIKKLGGNKGEKINCIPNNEEQYISFSKQIIVDKFVNKENKEVFVKRELRFIDSFKFMPSSLDALSKNLCEDQCKNLNEFYSGKKRDLLLRKGVYPYEYMDSIDRFSETKLPPKSLFYSKLNDFNISNEDYEHAQTVWKEFKCKTLRSYHNLYNKSDVLLLADVFENFRDVCMNTYKLDPAWYYTSPGLAWDAALKLTDVKLELLSNYDMFLMFQHGIRGGVSTISTRYAKANNKYMGKSFDRKKTSSYIAYLDANNLYGSGMSNPLPTSGFKWMNKRELLNWENITNRDGVGCILEVDLEYPKELHDLHNDYPLAPESLKLEGSTVFKLIPNLMDKTKYVIHYENLKLYESLGLMITKIHRGIKFQECAWLKKYIDLNTELRTKATNDFEKDFFKLMNNSVFGKTIQNVEKYEDIRLVCDKEEAIKLAAKPNFKKCTIFDENLVAIHMVKTKVYLNKPIYLGMSILDSSKIIMYDFHYNYIKEKYGYNAKLLFTDTDSLAYEIKTDDFYKDIADDVEARFDTSEYPKDHPSCIKVGINKKVLGKFKDEVCGKQIEEFVGLRAKLYSYKMFENKKETKKCKGVKKVVVEKTISHDDYKDCLFTKTKQLRSMNVFRSHLHDIYTETVNKIALSADDDKRIILDDGIHTLAYGHYKIMKP